MDRLALSRRALSLLQGSGPRSPHVLYVGDELIKRDPIGLDPSLVKEDASVVHRADVPDHDDILEILLALTREVR